MWRGSESDGEDAQQGLLGALSDTGGHSTLQGGMSGIGELLAVSCGRLTSRTSYAIAYTVGLLISPIGGVCVLGAGSIMAGTLLGVAKSAEIFFTSLAVVASLQCAYGCVSSPAREVSGTEVLAQLSGGDDTLWQAGKKLMKTFDKLLTAFPQMNRSRIAALRDGAPDELLLRVMTLIGKHQKQYQPEQAEGAHEDALDGAASADADVGKSGLGTAAAEEVVKELRYWIHFAEAAYYDMDTEDKISRWLAAEGCELLYASKRNAPHAPVYFVAVHQDRKELIVSLRGTEGVDDVITDMIVTPICWGDEDHSVHSGIGKSADTVYTRLKHLAPAFAGNGYSIKLIGHSLGAGVAALLAWRLREQDGIEDVHAVAYATPPCASPCIAEECRRYVVTCVFRDDVVPRLAPKAIVSLEKQLLELDWDEMKQCAERWGPLGGIILGRAKDAAETNKEELDLLEQQHREDPLGHGTIRDGGDGGGGNIGGEEGGDEASDEGRGVLMDPTVPGQIIFLHARSAEAKRMRAAGVRSEEGESASVPDDQREMDFEAVEIGAQEACLCAFRLAKQTVDDHLLDQYRMGLQMRPRIPGRAEDDPAQARLE